MHLKDKIYKRCESSSNSRLMPTAASL